jgi:hypothetical protein
MGKLSSAWAWLVDEDEDEEVCWGTCKGVDLQGLLRFVEEL